MNSNKERVAAILTSAMVSKLKPPILSLDPIKDIGAEKLQNDIIQAFQSFLQKLEDQKDKTF